MALKKQKEEIIDLYDETIPDGRPRLHKLSITNFRGITEKIEIELDDIVVLVGSNNAGKSTILRAYEIVMENSKMEQEDFPNYDTDKFKPEIELETIISKNVKEKLPAMKWVKEFSEEEFLIRERWVWDAPGFGKRQGFNVEKNEWDDKNVPWGPPNIASSRRPMPHRVDAFASPDKQSTEITKILMSIVEDKINAFKEKTKTEGETSEYTSMIKSIEKFRREILSDAQGEINKIESELQGSISRVFPNYEVKFDAKPERNLEGAIRWFEDNPSILMGPSSGFKSDISNQGSGARRTLLWSALKIISENSKKKKQSDETNRPHVLLLDEPEICLHPNAIREARDVLYDLPKSGNWQVMITTHSPIFIDITRDNTSIIRVERASGKVESTTIYRPDKASLTTDEKEHLKLLNIFDPYVAEFFFGGRTIIVEGDTEYSVFKYIIDCNKTKYGDVHILRARGKATIVALVKILNQFKKGYAVLNDSDYEKLDSGNANPAWTVNENIAKAVALKSSEINVKLCASITNFEIALFTKLVKTDKPYTAINKIKSEPALFAQAENLLNFLLGEEVDLGGNWVLYSSNADLIKAIAAPKKSK